jgi:beta-xylosidase
VAAASKNSREASKSSGRGGGSNVLFDFEQPPSEQFIQILCDRAGPNQTGPSIAATISMIEAVMLWNEPNNLSHWDFEIDTEWRMFATMIKNASQAIAAERPRLPKVLGGMSPIDPSFVANMERQGVLNAVEIIAIHGFPLDWNHWTIHEWPEKFNEIQALSPLPVWVSEVGVSTFGAEEVQEFGLQRTMELLLGRTPRLHWYSLFDLPREWPATTRHREAEGSSYYRHFYMGLLREDGTPKRALRQFAQYAPEAGICQWIHFDDPRLSDIVKWLQQIGVKRLRTGLSWADSCRPGAEAWFDRQMRAIEDFDVTLTFCFTPESCGLRPHHTSPPHNPQQFADFCGEMVRRYA